MQVNIYQLKDIETSYAFMGYDYAIHHNFTIDDYEIVWSGEINSNMPINTILELTYREFNVNKPSNFVGHSLSVSDLIEIDGKIYYCDDADWKLVAQDGHRA